MKLMQRLKRVVANTRFQHAFAWISVAILGLTTVFWTVLSVLQHELNADQFIDAFLFESTDTFQSALFPGAHTFLIKWPLFAVMSLFGYEAYVFLVATLVMVLVTVGVLVYLLHKIEPRPLVFGVLCLSLASVLLLVPAQPYPGALLPTNFGMTTTRNLEYAVFILVMYLFMKVRSFKTVTFWLLIVLMALVMASDKLFAVLAVGGGLVWLIGYAGILRRKSEAPLIGRWLLMSGVAFTLANVVLLLLSWLDVTGIVNESNASPFPLISSLGQLAQGLFYGIAALLTNFGANPIHGVTIIRDMPGALVDSVFSPTILPYLVNFGLLLFGLFAAVKVIAARHEDRESRLVVLLAGALLTALAVFVLTDHHYPVDARYVAIELFALFVAMAAFLRGRHIRTKYIGIVSLVFLITLPLGMLRSWQEFRGGQQALMSQNEITNKVARILDTERIGRLIGNYWDVVPVKPRAHESLTVQPTESCVKPAQVLNSTAWFRKPHTASAAYLAVRDPGKSTYDGCSLARLAAEYGTPSQRVLLAPNPNPPYDPNVLLLLYKNGTKPLPEQQTEKKVELPMARPVKALSEKAACPSTSLNVVAHQDDDLLFMNPDVANDIKAGNCIRTVYVTAGDAGEAANYWSSRENGAKAAYAAMYGVESKWHETRELLEGRFVTVSYLDGVPSVALLFMRLPDGNMHGEGFAGTQNQSLQMLVSGQVTTLTTVDNGTTYSKEQIVAALHGLMTTDQVATIRTQGSEDAADGDHSDHHSVGTLTQLARATYTSEVKLDTYIGYPTMSQPINLSDDVIADKQVWFLAYAKHDGAVCQSVSECEQLITYGSYLARQYLAVPTVPSVAAP
ncbi:MAG: hypothetical protein JWP13_508 [Candidatus Saccharibacteria bacterium]|nr:hypothetical protein [Candidatus Saccharibacteria bacterium]